MERVARQTLVNLAILAGCVAPGWPFMESPVRADLSCDQARVEAGEVRSGSPLAHRFLLVNRGKTPIEVTALRPSCGCLTPRLEPRHLLPGETGSLTLEINTLTQPTGPHSWGVRVLYREEGGAEGELALLLCASVITEIQVRPAALTLFTESAIGHEVVVTDPRPKPLAITSVQVSSPHVRASLAGPKTDEAGHWTRAIRLDVRPDLPPGRHDEVLHILTADPDYPELKVPVTVVKRPRLGVSFTPAVVELSGPASGPPPSRLVLLRGRDDREVTIEGVEADDPALVCQWSQGPHPVATVKVRLDPSRLSGGVLQSSIHVRLSQPAEETVAIPVTVTLR